MGQCSSASAEAGAGKQGEAPVHPSDAFVLSIATAKRDFNKHRGVRFDDCYEPVRLVGAGAYAKVIECRHKQSDKRFAAKIVEKHQMEREAVEKEVAVSRLLGGHQATLQVFDVYVEPDRYVLIMELCKGGELFSRIVKKGHFSEREAARYLRAMLEFVAHAHARGIVHCDLKPENVLLLNDPANDEKLVLKMADYGCCSFCSEGEKLTKPLGTPIYAAPEVLMHEYDHAADIWSMGVIAYVLFVGYPPFRGKTEADISAKVAEGKYSLESQGWDEVSAPAKAFVAAALQPNPRRRPTATELLKHPWFAFAESQPVEAPAPGKPARMAGMVDRLRAHVRADRFQRLALVVLARRHQNDTDEEAMMLRDLFREVDEDNCGTIDINEFRTALRKMGKTEAEVGEDEVKVMFEAADYEQTGRLDLGEFAAAVGSVHDRIAKQTTAAAEELMEALDETKDGYLTAGKVLKVLPAGSSMRDAEELLEAVDADGDGRLDVQDLKTMMRMLYERASRRLSTVEESDAAEQAA